jgi:transposase
VPQGRWRKAELLSAIRHDGVVAGVVFEGATDGAVFWAYVRRVLIPSLRPGETVVLDNLSAHRVGSVARALRKTGFDVWYLPPYSPDFNPIEKIWAKVKGYLRWVGVRTTAAPFEAVGEALRRVTAQDCRHSFEHRGYHATPERKPL